MTGTVTSIRGKQQSYCRITGSTGTVYFAHRSDFEDPSAMLVGTEVEFTVRKTSNGPLPNATDITALYRQAA